MIWRWLSSAVNLLSCWTAWGGCICARWRTTSSLLSARNNPWHHSLARNPAPQDKRDRPCHPDFGVAGPTALRRSDLSWLEFVDEIADEARDLIRRFFQHQMSGVGQKF